MSIEEAPQNTGLEELLSKKSNRLSDFDRKLRLVEIRDYAFSFVDEVCEHYEEDVLIIDNNNEYQSCDISQVYLSRANGLYEIGLNHAFYREFIKFGQKESESETAFFDIKPKYMSRTPQMLFNYQDHPNGVFDGFVRIFSKVHKVTKRAIEEDDSTEED